MFWKIESDVRTLFVFYGQVNDDWGIGLQVMARGIRCNLLLRSVKRTNFVLKNLQVLDQSFSLNLQTTISPSLLVVCFPLFAQICFLLAISTVNRLLPQFNWSLCSFVFARIRTTVKMVLLRDPQRVEVELFLRLAPDHEQKASPQPLLQSCKSSDKLEFSLLVL